MFSVLIRPLQEADSCISYKWRNDHDIWRFTGKRPDRQITKEIEYDWIRKALSESDSYRFAILADEEYIGNIQLTSVIAEEEGEYHIFIGDKSYWGKGIAKLASLQIIRFAKENLRLKAIYLLVNPENNAAIRVYEKLGFVKVSDEIKMVYDLTGELNPKLSVFMMTYNHEHYIKQAIDSILCQQTHFDFNIVIGEDCSTDNTREIVKAYASQYPGKFKLILHEKNIGPNANQIAVFSACKGDYIAMCEGDDYWTDPLKLQKQIDFLECNTEYSLCFHGAMEVHEDKCIPARPFASLNTGEYSGNEILLNWIVPTASVVFRNLPDLGLKYFDKYIFGDTPLFLKVCEYGKMWHMNEIMSVYRRHKNGAAANKKHYKQIIKQLRYINLEFDHKYNSSIRHLIGKKYFDLFREYYPMGSVRMFKYLFFSLFWDRTFVISLLKRRLSLILTK